MIDALPYVVLGCWLFSELRHQKEREGWGRERLALMQRAVPGLTLDAPAEVLPTPAYGSDEWEYGVEQERVKRGEA